MFTLNYKTCSEDVQIKFATLRDACIAARSLDPLKDQKVVADLYVSSEENPDGVFLIPSLDFLLKEVCKNEMHKG